MKKEIFQMVLDMVGHAYLYFEDPLIVKKTPHTWPVHIWAVCVSPFDEIYLMDANEKWHTLNEEELIIASLYQRLSTIKTKLYAAS